MLNPNLTVTDEYVKTKGLMVKHSHGSWNRTASILLVTAVNRVHCMLVLNENLPCTLQFIAGLLRQH